MKRRFLTLLLAVLTFSLAQPMYAQQTGTVKGTVTDETGAVIPATSVRIVSSTGVAREAQTNESGVYTITDVKPGRYTVRVNVPGCTAVETSVDVGPGRVATVDTPLPVALET